MEVLHSIIDWFRNFFGVHELLRIVHTGDYREVFTKDGILAVVRPVFPVLVFLELGKALVFRKFKAIDYKIPFFSYLLNAVVGRFIAFAMVVACIGLFQKYAIIKISFTWYWFIYGYIVWELGHFFYHYLGHKVRLFWCLHSTHHAPETMNLSISYAHFFLEGPYADIIRTTTCILLGVPPEMLLLIMFIDGVWGGFIHIGEHMLRDARLGPVGRFILTPSHHRVHHAKNPLYMDTNFCNLLNIWDKAFGTYQPEQKDVRIEYGITRPMRRNSFLDAYFGEFTALFRDMRRAPGLKNKFLYMIMPPGWSHTGEHKTASKVKAEYRKEPHSSKQEEKMHTMQNATTLSV